ncbi:uncharacterized protein LOC114528627 [Dendronephthya gigantea]|uniref:uncharacterized protein LOC114528627 n=1 Tax=Dendronephthya gigantea TaxID=151771 RepID=UPI00106A5ED9|nr:uncharacterized protein LOC114528627 [Dendronephthya gigantea]
MANFEGRNPVVKIQAVVRGFLVRRKFLRLKQEYDEIVMCFEGHSAKVRWKTDSKLCLPTVHHADFKTTGKYDVLPENGQQLTVSESNVDTDIARDHFKPKIEFCKNETCDKDILAPEGDFENEIFYPNNKTSLFKLREDLTMELLWIEQAIESRINYLKVKENMNIQASTN